MLFQAFRLCWLYTNDERHAIYFDFKLRECKFHDFRFFMRHFKIILKFWTESTNLRLLFSIILTLNTRNAAFLKLPVCMALPIRPN